MSADPPAAVHRAALEALRALAREVTATEVGADLPGRLAAQAAAAAGGRADPDAVAAMMATYVYAARVGASAAEPARAAMWLRGWSAARGREPGEVHQAVVEGVRFADRLHRALGLVEP